MPPFPRPLNPIPRPNPSMSGNSWTPPSNPGYFPSNPKVPTSGSSSNTWNNGSWSNGNGWGGGGTSWNNGAGGWNWGSSSSPPPGTWQQPSNLPQISRPIANPTAIIPKPSPNRGIKWGEVFSDALKDVWRQNTGGGRSSVQDVLDWLNDTNREQKEEKEPLITPTTNNTRDEIWKKNNFTPPASPVPNKSFFTPFLSNFQPGIEIEIEFLADRIHAWHFMVDSMFAGGSKFYPGITLPMNIKFGGYIKTPIEGFGFKITASPNGQMGGEFYIRCAGYRGTSPSGDALNYGISIQANYGLVDVPTGYVSYTNHGSGLGAMGSIRYYWSGHVGAIPGSFNFPKLSATDFQYPPNPLKEKEDMKCGQCEAARVIRSLQRTITVDATTISRMPTGDLITSTAPKTQRVFALPGTEQAVKEQFDVLAEIKKRAAHAFNQARRAKMMTRILQIMNITDFFLNIHNAMMISADIGETFFDAIFFVIDSIPKILDDIPLIGGFFETGEWQGFDSKELILKKVDELGKQAFGVKTWEEAKAKWAAFNQIIRTGNAMLMNMKDLRDSQGDLAEMSAERIAKLNNALIKAGILDENGNWMTENVNRRAAFLDKLEKIEESGVVNTAVFFQTIAAGVLDVQETKKELDESREEFKKAVSEGVVKLTGEATSSKSASQGATSSNDDAKPSE